MQEYKEEIEVKSKTCLTITRLLTNLLSAHLHTPSIVRVIDRGIGKEINRPENEIEMAMKQEVTPPTKTDFTAYKGKIRKSGTGGIYKLNDHLYEGRYTPTNAYGKRESCNVYGKTYEECEAKLEEMIARKRAEIAAEKERLKAMQTA